MLHFSLLILIAWSHDSKFVIIHTSQPKEIEISHDIQCLLLTGSAILYSVYYIVYINIY